jgi:23S rRNA (cytosine1962-C5)-methyltransferase
MKNALKGYRELNALGMRLIPVGGWLATFTCSGRVSREDFLKAVEKASLKLGQSYVVEQWLSQAPDHSVRLGFGESLYLKGLLLRRVA